MVTKASIAKLESKYAVWHRIFIINCILAAMGIAAAVLVLVLSNIQAHSEPDATTITGVLGDIESQWMDEDGNIFTDMRLISEDDNSSHTVTFAEDTEALEEKIGAPATATYTALPTDADVSFVFYWWVSLFFIPALCLVVTTIAYKKLKKQLRAELLYLETKFNNAKEGTA